MPIRAGTSGFSYKAWKGPFYPEGLSDKDMLHHYASRLPTVEINNTFYRMPKTETLSKWASTVPDDFVFILKASRQITHRDRLKGESDSVSYLWKQSQSLGSKLGPFLFQMPPYLKKDLPRLEAFVQRMPEGMRGAFEFRHQSWFDEEVYRILRSKDHAWVIADHEGKDVTVFPMTSSWGYLRLRKESYSDAALGTWIKKIQEAGWKDAYVFFKHEDEGFAPKLAERLLALEGAS